jgi:hypothetical protein
MIREQLTRHVAMDDEGTRGSRLVTAHDDDFIEVLLVTTHRYYSSLLPAGSADQFQNPRSRSAGSPHVRQAIVKCEMRTGASSSGRRYAHCQPQPHVTRRMPVRKPVQFERRNGANLMGGVEPEPGMRSESEFIGCRSEFDDFSGLAGDDSLRDGGDVRVPEILEQHGLDESMRVYVRGAGA